MQKWFLICFFLSTKLLIAQTGFGSMSAQFGPETGISLIMPKVTWRPEKQGFYVGGLVSCNVFAMLAVTAAPIIGYRYQSIATEATLAGTYFSAEIQDSLTGKRTSFNSFLINWNPKLILYYRKVYLGFGPSFSLLKPKVNHDTFWDRIPTQFNFEFGVRFDGLE
ncbi:MAG: hypothetical protein RLZZ628_3079 [Bacteroidota bacterium]|jgi:hypothetical protein